MTKEEIRKALEPLIIETEEPIRKDGLKCDVFDCKSTDLYFCTRTSSVKLASRRGQKSPGQHGIFCKEHRIRKIGFQNWPILDGKKRETVYLRMTQFKSYEKKKVPSQ